ncbi:MAG: hypothetical protein U0R64_09000 [Candidatus Nanopelagicales bacterium]
MSRLLRLFVLFLGIAALGGVTAQAASPTSDPEVTAQANQWKDLFVLSPSTRQDNELLAVGCSGNRCTAAGIQGGSELSGQATVLTMKGAKRRAQAQLIPGASLGTLPWDVSCPEPRWCAIVGSVHTPDPSDSTWAVTGSGRRWTRASTPSPLAGGTTQSYLASVDCQSRDRCVAVGHWFDSLGDTQPMILKWNGTRWRWVMRDALPGMSLNEIDCVSATRCLIAANGTYDRFYWLDGRRLTRVSGPRRLQNDIGGLSCVSGRWCVASGAWDASEPRLAVITANRWKQKAVRVNRPTGVFNGVACVAKNQCLVATSWTENGYLHPAVWQWRGSRTSTVKMPFTLDRVGQAMAIDCGATRCTTVGQGYIRDGEFMLQGDAYSRPKP